MMNTYNNLFIIFQLHYQLNQIRAIHHPVVPMLSATMESVTVCQNIREIPMLGVDLNVFSVQTVQETELVSETSVRILVLALVVKEQHVM
jgi:hypothetical protein